MIRALIVEDEQSLREPLVYLLQKEGYDVVIAADGNEAITKFEKNDIDIVVLDLMLPGIDGNEVCRQIRRNSQVPIIMLTAKDSEIDKVVSLELGADDYVTKPYSTRELLARMKAVLRRNTDPAKKSKSIDVMHVGPVKMDLERHEVFVNDVKVSLPLKEFDLLEVLMTNANRVLTRTQLIEEVWGQSYYGDTKTLDVHIKRLRSKVEADPANPVHLLTVRGVGYKFEE